MAALAMIGSIILVRLQVWPLIWCLAAPQEMRAGTRMPALRTSAVPAGTTFSGVMNTTTSFAVGQVPTRWTVVVLGMTGPTMLVQRLVLKSISQQEDGAARPMAIYTYRLRISEGPGSVT